MKLLVKYPSRARPAAFLARLREWKQAAADPQGITWLVSYDLDDATMTPDVLESARIAVPGIILCGGNSRTKIEACNADMEKAPDDWQVVLLLSDDMWCARVGWDDMIRAKMKEHFPDTDGSLWFYDGEQKDINTLTCYGRKYYERFAA